MNDHPKTMNGRWWGEFEIPTDQGGCWRIGPLTLWIEHRGQEWRLAHLEDRQSPAESAEVRCPYPPEPPGETSELVRAAVQNIDGRLVLTPSLADRSIVARPETPFRLLAGAEVALYVSTPVWVRVEIPEPPLPLLDVPTSRLTDTWFGPSTLDGELCYAIHTAARLDLTNLDSRPERAITEVRLRNLADTVEIERLNLPLNRLSLYADGDSGLWTQAMTIERRQDGKLGEVHFDDRPPMAAESGERVAGPRELDRRPSVIRALTGLFG